DKFWVLEWLDEKGVDTIEDVATLLRKPRTISDLRARAEAASEKQAIRPPENYSVLAGTGIDLTGGHSVCPGINCMRSQVDTLFKRVWHYFDRIVARDAVTPLLLGGAGPQANIADLLLSDLAPLLYLREIGADSLIDFVPKHFCSEWRKHAEEIGLD